MQSTCLINRYVIRNSYQFRHIIKRSLLSEAYLCEDAWKRRLENPVLKDVKMNQYFVETDKKFGTKRSVSGLDIDLFANRVEMESQLDELEHLLYRFRRTRRSIEMMDSTIYAVIKVFLKFKQYESLFRILNDRDSYGIFPDMYSYNILMSTFLKEKLYKEAAQSAILMMLQEDFSNNISRTLGLFSCQMFLNECELESLSSKDAVEEQVESTNDDDEDDVKYVRVPFLRSPWFDDHFNITNPKHLVGKTLYLIGREMHDLLGRSYQLVGLTMHEKWDKAADLMKSFSETEGAHIVSEVIDKVKQEIDSIPDDDSKVKEQISKQFDDLFQQMKSNNKIVKGDLMSLLQEHFKDLLKSEESDIIAQKQLFSEWETQRMSALQKQNRELEKERRIKVIKEKKEYLFWKEKLLFFFENEDNILEEHKKVNELVETLKSTVSVEETYVPPEIIRKPMERMSKYKKLARVKKV